MTKIASLSRIPIAANRAGISLLEVMISIGLLSVGLMACLALIPAGRTYMQKADLDNRAATLIPNAFSTMQTLGLFRTSAIFWRELNQPDTDKEQTARRSPPPGWDPKKLEREFIETWHTTADAHPTVSGTAPANSQVKLRGASQEWTTTTGSNGTWSITPNLPTPPYMQIYNTNQGGQEIGAVISPFWTDYTFTAEHSYTVPGDLKDNPNGTGNDEVRWQAVTNLTITPSLSAPRIGNEPAAPSYRHYYLRRKKDRQEGKAFRDYRVTPADRRNETANAASELTVPPLGETVFEKRITYVHRSTINLTGHLWRFQEGRRRGNYSVWFSFDNVNNAVKNIIKNDPYDWTHSFPGGAEWVNGGDEWVDAGDEPKTPNAPDILDPVKSKMLREDLDWIKVPVEAGQTIKFDWSNTDPVVLRESLDDFPHRYDGAPSNSIQRVFPIYLNGSAPANLLEPREQGEKNAIYSIPGDGYILTRVALKPASLDNNGNVDVTGDTYNSFETPYRVNTIQDPIQAPPASGFGREPNVAGVPWNPEYKLDITLFRNDRVIAVDPMMATRLDQILAARGIDVTSNTDPWAIARKRFANFQQTFAGSQTARAFVIPRLNWQMISSNRLDHAIAIADRLCRPEDTLETIPNADADKAPSPRFDKDISGNPLRRQAAGRMSWLITMQPEDPGSVAANWQAGKYFDVSLVIFENRLLPSVQVPDVEGEYAFRSTWSDNDGMLFVSIPSAMRLLDDDVRKLFRTGAWLLLAPQVAYAQASIEDRQELNWAKIQTCEFERTADSITAKVLLETEPSENVLVRDANAPNVQNGRVPLVVLAYQGVVSVINRSIRLEE